MENLVYYNLANSPIDTPVGGGQGLEEGESALAKDTLSRVPDPSNKRGSLRLRVGLTF